MFVGEIFYTGLVRGARRPASTGDEQVGVLVIDNVRLCFTDLARSVEFSHTARFGVIVEDDRAVTSTRSSVSLYGSSASLERLAARAMEAPAATARPSGGGQARTPQSRSNPGRSENVAC